jgi:hypothetical protein
MPSFLQKYSEEYDEIASSVIGRWIVACTTLFCGVCIGVGAVNIALPNRDTVIGFGLVIAGTVIFLMLLGAVLLRRCYRKKTSILPMVENPMVSEPEHTASLRKLPASPMTSRAASHPKQPTEESDQFVNPMNPQTEPERTKPQRTRVISVPSERPKQESVIFVNPISPQMPPERNKKDRSRSSSLPSERSKDTRRSNSLPSPAASV